MFSVILKNFTQKLGFHLDYFVLVDKVCFLLFRKNLSLPSASAFYESVKYREIVAGTLTFFKVVSR
jgi:hypothetical protein